MHSYTAGSPCDAGSPYVGFLGGTRALALPQHADQHRSKYPVLLAVNQHSAKVRLSG
jgi:hypothetical protein